MKRGIKQNNSPKRRGNSPVRQSIAKEKGGNIPESSKVSIGRSPSAPGRKDSKRKNKKKVFTEEEIAAVDPDSLQKRRKSDPAVVAIPDAEKQQGDDVAETATAHSRRKLISTIVSFNEEVNDSKAPSFQVTATNLFPSAKPILQEVAEETHLQRLTERSMAHSAGAGNRDAVKRASANALESESSGNDKPKSFRDRVHKNLARGSRGSSLNRPSGDRPRSQIRQRSRSQTIIGRPLSLKPIRIASLARCALFYLNITRRIRIRRNEERLKSVREKAAFAIQCFWRRIGQKERVRQRCAASFLVDWVRRKLALRKSAKEASAFFLQRVFRGERVRSNHQLLYEQMRLNRAIRVIQKFIWRWNARKTRDLLRVQREERKVFMLSCSMTFSVLLREERRSFLDIAAQGVIKLHIKPLCTTEVWKNEVIDKVGYSPEVPILGANLEHAQSCQGLESGRVAPKVDKAMNHNLLGDKAAEIYSAPSALGETAYATKIVGIPSFNRLNDKSPSLPLQNDGANSRNTFSTFNEFCDSAQSVTMPPVQYLATPDNEQQVVTLVTQKKSALSTEESARSFLADLLTWRPFDYPVFVPPFVNANISGIMDSTHVTCNSTPLFVADQGSSDDLNRREDDAKGTLDNYSRPSNTPHPFTGVLSNVASRGNHNHYHRANSGVTGSQGRVLHSVPSSSHRDSYRVFSARPGSNNILRSAPHSSENCTSGKYGDNSKLWQADNSKRDSRVPSSNPYEQEAVKSGGPVKVGNGMALVEGNVGTSSKNFRLASAEASEEVILGFVSAMPSQYAQAATYGVQSYNRVPSASLESMNPIFSNPQKDIPGNGSFAHSSGTQAHQGVDPKFIDSSNNYCLMNLNIPHSSSHRHDGAESGGKDMSRTLSQPSSYGYELENGALRKSSLRLRYSDEVLSSFVDLLVRSESLERKCVELSRSSEFKDLCQHWGDIGEVLSACQKVPHLFLSLLQSFIVSSQEIQTCADIVNNSPKTNHNGDENDSIYAQFKEVHSKSSEDDEEGQDEQSTEKKDLRGNGINNCAPVSILEGLHIGQRTISEMPFLKQVAELFFSERENRTKILEEYLSVPLLCLDRPLFNEQATIRRLNLREKCRGIKDIYDEIGEIESNLNEILVTRENQIAIFSQTLRQATDQEYSERNANFSTSDHNSAKPIAKMGSEEKSVCYYSVPELLNTDYADPTGGAEQENASIMLERMKNFAISLSARVMGNVPPISRNTRPSSLIPAQSLSLLNPVSPPVSSNFESSNGAVSSPLEKPTSPHVDESNALYGRKRKVSIACIVEEDLTNQKNDPSLPPDDQRLKQKDKNKPKDTPLTPITQRAERAHLFFPGKSDGDSIFPFHSGFAASITNSNEKDSNSPGAICLAGASPPSCEIQRPFWTVNEVRNTCQTDPETPPSGKKVKREKSYTMSPTDALLHFKRKGEDLEINTSENASGESTGDPPPLDTEFSKSGDAPITPCSGPINAITTPFFGASSNTNNLVYYVAGKNHGDALLPPHSSCNTFPSAESNKSAASFVAPFNNLNSFISLQDNSKQIIAAVAMEEPSLSPLSVKQYMVSLRNLNTSSEQAPFNSPNAKNNNDISCSFSQITRVRYVPLRLQRRLKRTFSIENRDRVIYGSFRGIGNNIDSNAEDNNSNVNFPTQDPLGDLFPNKGAENKSEVQSHLAGETSKDNEQNAPMDPTLKSEQSISKPKSPSSPLLNDLPKGRDFSSTSYTSTPNNININKIPNVETNKSGEKNYPNQTTSSFHTDSLSLLSGKESTGSLGDCSTSPLYRKNKSVKTGPTPSYWSNLQRSICSISPSQILQDRNDNWRKDIIGLPVVLEKTKNNNDANVTDNEKPAENAANPTFNRNFCCPLLAAQGKAFVYPFHRMSHDSARSPMPSSIAQKSNTKDEKANKVHPFGSFNNNASNPPESEKRKTEYPAKSYGAHLSSDSPLEANSPILSPSSGTVQHSKRVLLSPKLMEDRSYEEDKKNEIKATYPEKNNARSSFLPEMPSKRKATEPYRTNTGQKYMETI